MTAPSAAHQDGGDKYATGVSKIGARENIVIGTWNIRTLRPAGKLQELMYEMARYQWHVLGLCEMRWKSIGEIITDEGHKVYYSGHDSRHESGVGFIVRKEVVPAVMGCQPVSSRIITLRIRASPFNIYIIQAYAPTSDHDEKEVDAFFHQLQGLIAQKPKNDILVVQGDWNAKIGKDTARDWKGVCGQYCNELTNDRGLKLLEFATYNKLVVTNTLGPHKPSRIWTWHSPDGRHHNQIDYILVSKRFKSSVNIARTRSFPGADVGSDHDQLLMTFKL